MERLDELLVAHTRAEINEGLLGNGGGAAEMIERFGARVGLLAFVHDAALDVLRVDGNFHLEHVYVILRLGELLHAARHDPRFDLGEFESFFVAALRVVADEFQEKRDLVVLALGADALDEGVLDVVDRGIVERRVVDENLHRVGAPVHNSPGRDLRQQVRQAAGPRVVVAAFFVSEEQAAIRAARLPGVEAEFGVQQDRAGVGREDFGDGGLELRHHLGRDVVLVDALGGRDRLLQTAPLIHRRGGDDSARVSEGFHVLQFSFG